MAEEKQLAQAVSEKIGPNKEFSSNLAFAERVGVSEATIQRIRHGHIPSLTTLRKMAEAIPEWGLLELQRMAGVEDIVAPGGERDEFSRALVNASALLTPAEQRAVMALIKSLVTARKDEERKANGGG